MIVTGMLPEQIDGVKALLDTCFGKSAWSKEAIRSQLEKSDSRCFLAVENGEIVGFLAFEQIVDEGSIIEVAVSPAYRRRGIARELIGQAIRDSADLSAVFLEVRESNTPAIALYDSLGFEQIAVRRDYYDHPKENAVVMQLILRKNI